MCKIEKIDVEMEIWYWENAVLCDVLGVNLFFEIMYGFIERIWKVYYIGKIVLVRGGLFMLKFDIL